MKIESFVYYFSLCVIIFSCSGKSHSNKNSLQRVDAAFSKEMTLKLSDFTESIELIPLQTDEECLIGTVGKIKFRNDMYYVGSASMQTDKILVFGEDGEFLYKLDKRGQGPDEYLEIQDFDVMENSNVLIITQSDHRLCIYNIEQDVCLVNIRLDVYPTNLLIEGEHVFLSNRGIKPIMSNGENETSEYALYEFDLQGNLIDSYYKLNDVMRKKMAHFLPVRSFDANNNKIYFHYPFCDTIYEIKNKDLLPVFYLDFGTKKLSEDMFQKNIRDILDIVADIKRNQGVFTTKTFGITTNFIHFAFQDFENNGYVAFYDIKNDQTVIGHHLVDDILFLGNKYTLESWKLPKSMDGEDLIWHIEANHLKDAYESYKKRASKDEWSKFCSKHKGIFDICENLDEEDNPVLARIKINLK